VDDDRVPVHSHGDDRGPCSDQRLHPELLAELATQARLEALAGLALASRKLPAPAPWLSRPASGHEVPSLPLDESRRRLDDREAGRSGQLREERKEGRAVVRPHAPMTARVRGMEDDDDLAGVDPEAAAMVVGEPDGRAEDRPGGDGADGHHHAGSQ